VVDAIDHVPLLQEVAAAAVGPVVVRFLAGRSRARRRARGRARSPGRSFHTDGSSSKWICAEELACQPQGIGGGCFADLAP